MRIHTNINFESGVPTAVALGFFDGVHRGHQAVIKKAVECCKSDMKAVVFTFTIGDSAPARKKSSHLIQSTLQREMVMHSLGVDEVVIPDFKEFSGLPAKDFAERVIGGQMYAKYVVCGEDFRFGKGASSGVAELKGFLEPFGVSIVTVPAVWHLGAPISSTRIRAAIEKGELGLANDMLGRPFSIAGEVVHGKKLGRKLGFPTVNIPVPDRLSLPPFGVYASTVNIDGKIYPAVSNLGVRPTVTDIAAIPNLESYIIGYDGDLYGRELSFSFHSFLRAEKRFESIDELKIAISGDARKVEEITDLLGLL